MTQTISKKDECWVSSNKAKLDVGMIHGFLTETYWAKGITLEQVREFIANSICYGLYYQNKQIGFARVITDSVTFAYLCDVFVLPEFRGQGLGKLLVQAVLASSEVVKIKRWLLLTNDMQPLYKQFNFNPHPVPDRVMVMLKN